MQKPQTDAAAISPWDGEGGSATPFELKTDAPVSGNGQSEAGVPVSEKVDQASAEEEQILGWLGAAVIMRWGTLPTKIQRELFEHATCLADLTQTTQLKGQIARFLHNHKNDGVPIPRQGMA